MVANSREYPMVPGTIILINPLHLIENGKRTKIVNIVRAWHHRDLVP